mgnify:CR=1 FL=1
MPSRISRVPSPAIRATRVDGGWRLDGHAPWATSWGIADWFTVAAVGPTGEVVSIKPRPGRGEEHDRWNWDGPILISGFDPARLYVASQRLWRSDDRGDSWTALSDDLTRDEDRLLRPMMGRVWSIDAVWDLLAMSMYGTITSLAESPLDERLLYAGTDDGLIQVSEDGGQTWRQCKRPRGVPERIYVNNLVADRFERVYVSDAIGCIKPEAEAFRLVQRDAGGRAVTYVDDKPANVAVAAGVFAEALREWELALQGLLFGLWQGLAVRKAAAPHRKPSLAATRALRSSHRTQSTARERGTSP